MSGRFGLISENGPMQRLFAETDVSILEAHWRAPNGDAWGFWFSPAGKTDAPNKVLVRFDDPSGDVEAGDRRTDAIIAAIQADGTLWLGGTRWHGLRAMRISVSGWSTSEADVDASLAVIRRVADEVHGG